MSRIPKAESGVEWNLSAGSNARGATLSYRQGEMEESTGSLEIASDVKRIYNNSPNHQQKGAGSVKEVLASPGFLSLCRQENLSYDREQYPFARAIAEIWSSPRSITCFCLVA